MESDFVGYLDFPKIEFITARDVLLYSFIVQKSVVRLDLSACEYSLQTRSIFTDEGCKKKFKPGREILYRLHLDLPRKTEKRIRAATPGPDQWIQYESLSVGDCVYNDDFAPSIVNSIENAENKVETLRRYFYIMKLLKLHEHDRIAIFLFDSIIHILYSKCTDSELITEFALTFQFSSWIFHHENPGIVGFVLHHVRQTGHHIWRVHQGRVDLISGCMIAHSPGNVYKLLEYGTVFPCQFSFYNYVRFPGDDDLNFDALLLMPRRRVLLLLQFYWVFMSSDNNSFEALCYIWRSIPDPYLFYEEINLAFGGFTSTNLQEMVESYKNKIVEEKDSDYVVPISLQHLCRVSIRGSLNRTYQLPDGIMQLCVPFLLKTYLNLEI